MPAPWIEALTTWAETSERRERRSRRSLVAATAVGGVTVRWSCWVAPYPTCGLYWRRDGGATWSHVPTRSEATGDHGTRVALRHDARRRIVFVTNGANVDAAFALDPPAAEPRRTVPDPRDDWREYIREGFVPVTAYAGSVAPRWPAVALALAGLLAALALRATDRPSLSRRPSARGYRDDAWASWPDIGYAAARIEHWARDEALEGPLRTLAVIGSTHVPLAVALAVT